MLHPASYRIDHKTPEIRQSFSCALTEMVIQGNSHAQEEKGKKPRFNDIIFKRDKCKIVESSYTLCTLKA